MTSWIIFIAGLAISAYGLYREVRISQAFIYYGLKEKTTMFQGPDGHFDIKKLWIVFVVQGIAATAFGLFGWAFESPDQWGNVGLLSAGCGAAGFGIVRIIVALNAERKAREFRVKQIAVRASWKASGLPNFTQQSRNGLYFHPTFAWIRKGTIDALRAALTEWLALPDDKAWPDTEYE